jgi:hypothetical protein
MNKTPKHKVKFVREIEILKSVKNKVSSDQIYGFPELYYYEATPDLLFYVMNVLG